MLHSNTQRAYWEMQQHHRKPLRRVDAPCTCRGNGLNRRGCDGFQVPVSPGAKPSERSRREDTGGGGGGSGVELLD